MMRFSVITPTNDSKWLADVWASLQSQTFTDFEWVVMVNDKFGSRGACDQVARNVRKIVGDDKRVRIAMDTNKFVGIGATKKRAFSQGHGEVLVELDHDDILLPDALAELDKAFEDEAVGFVYSDWADFDGTVKEGQGKVETYMTDRRQGWLDTGYQFYTETVGGPRPGTYECVRALPPTGPYVSHIYTAPNHVRAWRKSVYDEAGGHSEKFAVADDAELMIQTYLVARFAHIAKPLYLYRVSGKNTWSKNVEEIKVVSNRLMNEYMEKLVSVWCEREGKKRVDLSAGDLREGWDAWDVGDLHSCAEMEEKNGSVGVIRASDFLCKHADKERVMNRIWRALCDGGILLSDTPSTDGRGAFQDPTNVGYWNENSFWYWTKPEFRQFLKMQREVPFRPMYVGTYLPSPFHVANKIPYVRAWLVAVKD